MRHAVLVVLAAAVLAGLCVLAASTRLGVSTDTDALFANSLPWKQRKIELDRAFPQYNDLIVAVIQARVPEEADATAAGLAAALAADPAHFKSVQTPGASPYFTKNGLLFLPKATLGPLLDHTVDAQPFLGQLAADPSARGLFSALSLIALGVERGQADLGSYGAALDGFQSTLASVLAGSPQPLSWQSLLGGGVSELAGPYRFVLAHPVLDFNALRPGGAATDALRADAAKLEFVASGAATVRLTGSVPLSDEEFASVAQGVVAELVGSLILVTIWLFLAVGSWRVIVPILLTLFLGLALTTGFAALAVGTLNLISVAFAVLFVGIAVDFAIQWSVRFREMRQGAPDDRVASVRTARRAGVQVLVAAAATASGFLAFVPTAFVGVAQLGLIAGTGMVIAFGCTILFLPAALTLFAPRVSPGEIGFTRLRVVDAAIGRLRLPLLGLFAVLAVAGVVGIGFLRFDADPLDTKNPHTEAMETLRKLMSNPLTNPYTIDVLEPDQAAASRVAAALQTLPSVASVMTLASFVPDDQAPKLAMISDTENVLAATLGNTTASAPVTAEALRMAASSAAASLTRAAAKLPPDSPLAKIAADLQTLSKAPDTTLLAANTALTEFLPAELDALRSALTAGPVSLSSLPPDLVRDWMLPNGEARVSVTPKPGFSGGAGLGEFVRQVTAVAPEAGGSAVTIIATSRTIVDAFRDAAIGAIVAIALILLLVLRRLLDAALVMASLLLSALMTVVVSLLLGLPLNFANIIALPLLLGVGVSFNIYFVMNWRAGEHSRLASPTARAVMFSALTTGTAFGSLALSAHRGTASMGTLLLISLGCTLVSTLLFVPALLAVIPAPEVAHEPSRS